MFSKSKPIKFVRLPALLQAKRTLPPVVDYSKYESPAYLRCRPARARIPALLRRQAE